jgi:hypothetical protein
LQPAWTGAQLTYEARDWLQAVFFAHSRNTFLRVELGPGNIKALSYVNAIDIRVK